jgi:hypothetical protein
VKKDPELADTPPLTARLTALITAVPDQDLHTQIGALLSKIVHTLPDLARGILESVLSSMLAAETPDQRVALIQTLRTCLRTVDCKKALPDWPIDKGMLFQHESCVPLTSAMCCRYLTRDVHLSPLVFNV